MPVEERNEQIIRDFYSTINNKDFEGLRQYIHPDYTPKNRGMASMQRALSFTEEADRDDLHIKGAEPLIERIKLLFEGMGEFRATLQNLICNDDEVWVDVQFEGIHQSKLFGIDPTNKLISYRAFLIYKIKDRQIIQNDVLIDWLSMLHQLGFFVPKISDPKVISQYLSTINQLRDLMGDNL